MAKEIPDNASLFINIGTTTEAVAQALCDHRKLKIITNNLNVATMLTSNENFELIVAGGMVRHRDSGIIGVATIDFIKQFNAKTAIPIMIHELRYSEYKSFDKWVDKINGRG